MITRTYAVGQSNTVRRRDNNAGGWIDVSIPSGPIGAFELFDVMTDPNNSDRVVAVGEVQGIGTNTGIMVSYDAGVTWFQPTGSWSAGKVMYEVWWVDSNVIWVVGDQGVVARSTDGGLTFNITPTRPAAGTYGFTSCIHALDDQIVVVGGSTTSGLGVNDTLVWKSSDGGATWTTLNGGVPLPNPNTPNPVGPPGGIWISPDEQRIIVSTGYTQNLSINSGTSFSNVNPEMVRSGMHLTWYPAYGITPQRFRHIGGPVIAVNESSNQGTAWTITRTGSFETIRGAHFYDINDGYYIMDNMTYETADGGVTGSLTDSVAYILNAVWTGVWPPAPIDPPCGECPEGFTLNSITGLCERREELEPTCGPSYYTAGPGAKSVNYSVNGARFYENATLRPFPLSHTSAANIEDAAAAPLNLVSTVATAPWNTRLNDVGVWNSAANTPYNEWIGFTACLELVEEKTYYIGIAGDNYVRFSLNGTLVFESSNGSLDAFRNWFMIPLTLPAGTNIIELEGLNLGLIAAFGAEIYDADLATLSAMTLPAQIDAVTVFSTGNVIGSTFDLGEQSGCQCPEGYSLSTCQGFTVCVIIETAPFNPCPCYLATNCDDPGETYLFKLEDGSTSLDITLTYVLDVDLDKCWTIEDSVDCDDTTPVGIVTDSFADCQDCGGACYLLTNCATQETIVVDDPTLAQFNGEVIEVIVDPNTTLCLLVEEVPCFEAIIVPLPGTIVECYTTCERCLPAPLPPPEPLNIRNRTVKPGYNTPGCPPEYVDKVNCKFAEAMYQEAISTRYGIEFCCENAINQDKWVIKKELLDLKMITDLDACKAAPSDCCPPCNVESELVLYSPVLCPAPTNVDAQLDI